MNPTHQRVVESLNENVANWTDIRQKDECVAHILVTLFEIIDEQRQQIEELQARMTPNAKQATTRTASPDSPPPYDATRITTPNSYWR